VVTGYTDIKSGCPRERRLFVYGVVDQKVLASGKLSDGAERMSAATSGSMQDHPVQLRIATSLIGTAQATEEPRARTAEGSKFSR